MKKVLCMALAAALSSLFCVNSYADSDFSISEDAVSDEFCSEEYDGWSAADDEEIISDWEFDISDEENNELTVDGFLVNEDLAADFEDDIYAAVHRHTAVTTNVIPQNINDSKKHRATYTCKTCHQQYTKDLNHVFKTRIERDGNNNVYHNSVKYCYKCGYVSPQKKQIKHSFYKGVCGKCGHQNTTRVYKAGGECAAYLCKPRNDSQIYVNCPKCGSYSSSYAGKQLIRKNQPIAGGARISIWHQRVKCNDCGKKYLNRCYHQ